MSEPPHAWAVIPPDQNISRHVEVLLSVDTSILAVDNLESIDQRVARGPFSRVSPSPNGKLLALLNYSGLLWVVSTDFQRSLAEFDTQTVGAEGPVNQVEWCGNDAIFVTWENFALLVGPSGDTLRYVAARTDSWKESKVRQVFLLRSNICSHGTRWCARHWQRGL